MRHEVVPVNILEQFVMCHATQKAYPKFIKQQTAKPVFSVLNLEPAPEKKQEEQWVKDLYMHHAQLDEF